MRWLLSFLLFAFASSVQALSTTGNRLLVVVDNIADKDKYSQFWKDLECKTCPCEEFNNLTDEIYSKRLRPEVRDSQIARSLSFQARRSCLRPPHPSSQQVQGTGTQPLAEPSRQVHREQWKHSPNTLWRRLDTIFASVRLARVRHYSSSREERSRGRPLQL